MKPKLHFRFSAALVCAGLLILAVADLTAWLLAGVTYFDPVLDVAIAIAALGAVYALCSGIDCGGDRERQDKEVPDDDQG